MAGAGVGRQHHQQRQGRGSWGARARTVARHTADAIIAPPATSRLLDGGSGAEGEGEDGGEGEGEGE
jgi:hypothetical protein